MNRGSPGPEAVRALVSRIAPSVVSVIAYDAGYSTVAEGCGYFSAEGRVTTSRHLFHGAKSARVMLAGGAVHDVLGVLAEDPQTDLALIAVDIPDRTVKPIPPARGVPKSGESLALVGGRLSTEKDGVTGESGGLREYPLLGRILRAALPIPPALSGAPVVCMDGVVAGVAVGRSTPKGSLSYVVPVGRAEDLSSVQFVKVADRRPPGDGQDPDRFLPALRLLLGEDVEGAVEALEAVAKENPRDAAAWSAAAECLVSLGKTRPAMEAARAAVAIDPDCVSAWESIGVACAAAGMHAEAVEACRRVVRTKQRSARAWNRLGVASYNAGRPAEAADSCKEAIRLSPDDAQEHKNLGVAYFALGRFPDAIDAFREAVRLRPEFENAWKNLGMTYFRMGSYEKSVEATLEAIRIRPDYARAHNNLGVAYQALGRLDEAIEAYKEAVRLKPRFGQAWANLASAYTKQGKHEDAVRAYEEAVARDPFDTASRTGLAALLQKAGRVQEARAALEEAVKNEPKSGGARLAFGLLLLEQGDRGAAMDQYKALKDLDPARADALFAKVYK